MGSVRELFPGQPPPVPDPEPEPGDEFIDWFIENRLSHTTYLMQYLEEATSEEEFRDRMALVQKDVAAWPVK